MPDLQYDVSIQCDMPEWSAEKSLVSKIRYAMHRIQGAYSLVIMTNNDSGAALWDEILNSVSVEYGLVPPDLTALYVGITAVVLVAVPVFLLLRRKRAKSSASRPNEDA